MSSADMENMEGYFNVGVDNLKQSLYCLWMPMPLFVKVNFFFAEPSGEHGVHREWNGVQGLKMYGSKEYMFSTVKSEIMDLDGPLCNSINLSEYFTDIEGFIL